VRGYWKNAAVLAAAIFAVAGCSGGDTADVTAAELAVVTQRDGMVFDDSSIPDRALDRLAEHRVVLLGETHHLREHWAFVATLLSDLHEAGFRQLLIEAPQMAGWLLDDYVRGGPLVPEWEAPPFYERRLAAIRALNETLPSDERIHVRAIDANEEWYGGASDFVLLLGWVVDHLPDSGDVDVSLGANYPDAAPATQKEAIAALLESLEADRATLVAAWGADWHDRVIEMAEVELSSIDVRAQRRDDDNDAARAREQIVKRLADERIAECSCGTVINIGGHHAQKSHLMGTEQEWMGDYLAHQSTVVAGSIIVVGFSSARTELESGAGGTPWNILESESPDNELFRVMAETWPGQNVFLPLDDSLFSDRTVAFNSEDVIYATPLKEQYDAIVQYGLAHRMPED
jgi:hypothetical protein